MPTCHTFYTRTKTDTIGKVTHLDDSEKVLASQPEQVIKGTLRQQRCPGTFSLLEPLYNKQTCEYGHNLKPQDEQFFSGINKDSQEFACSPNATTVILGGAMRITCKDRPMKVEARVCRFENFVKVSEKLREKEKVKNYAKIHLVRYNFPGTPWSHC